MLVADWCKVCHTLKEGLAETNNLSYLPIQRNGNVTHVPLVWADVTDYYNSSKIYEAQTSRIPELQILVGGKLVEGVSYFFDVENPPRDMAKALGSQVVLLLDEIESPPSPSSANISSIESKDLSSKGIVLIGTGKEPMEVPLFVGHSFRSIKNILADKGVSPESIVTLFGSGGTNERSSVKETTYWIESESYGRWSNGSIRGSLRHKNPDGLISSESTLNLENLGSVFNKAKNDGAKTLLFVYSGHGGKNGLPMWGKNIPLKKEPLQRLHSQSGIPSVILSGNCYGGQFAGAPSCGFFGARPDTLASGCWENENARVKDYVATFFKTLEDPKYSDFDGDGSVTLEEAHWFATLYGAQTDITYSTLDHLAEEYFEKYPNRLSNQISVAELFGLVKEIGTAGEIRAVETLLENKAEDFQVFLKNREVSIDGDFSGNIKIDVFGVEPEVLKINEVSINKLDQLAKQYKVAWGFKDPYVFLRWKIKYLSPFTQQDAQIIEEDPDLVPMAKLLVDDKNNYPNSLFVSFQALEEDAGGFPLLFYEYDTRLRASVAKTEYDLNRLFSPTYRQQTAQVAKRLLYKKEVQQGRVKDLARYYNVVNCESTPFEFMFK